MTQQNTPPVTPPLPRTGGRSFRLMFILLMLAYWPRAFTHDFIASSEWWTAGLCLAFAGSALVAKALLSRQRQPGEPNVLRPMRAALLSLFTLIALYSVLVCGVGAFATWMKGKNITDTFPAYASASAGLNCLRLEDADIPICLSPQKFRNVMSASPEYPPRVKLEAKRSWFGTIVYPPVQ